MLPGKLKYLYIALFAAILIMAISALSMIASAIKESKNIENSARDTLAGNANQANYELFQFIDVLTAIQTGDREVSKKLLIARFDILWSRYLTNTTGKSGKAFLQLAGARQAMQKIKIELETSEERVLNLDMSNAEDAARLAEKFRLLVPEFHKVSIEANGSAVRTASKFYDYLKNVGFWTQILLPGMIITSFLVGIILWLDRKSLNALTQNLELRVRERTNALQRTNNALTDEISERKLTEAKLVQAQKMETVGQLTGGLAHDFNNLLAIIQGNAELLDDIETDKFENYVKPILRASQRGGELTHRLLAFSRKQPLQPKTLDIYLLMSNMSVLLNHAAGETITINFIYEENLWNALADPGQVENALLNLVINSRHAMPDGGEIKVCCENFTADQAYININPEASIGDYVVITVSDTGVGIEKELLTRVCEPFFTTKRVGTGSGLGLAMVYGFIKQSGGHIDISSEVGAGTTVKLFLPRSKNISPDLTPTLHRHQVHLENQ